MSRPLAPVAVVAPSSRDLNRWILDRPRHETTVIPVDVPPTADPTLALVCDAVLTGLGKDSDLTHGKTAPVPLSEAWLSLGEHTDAVIVDAQLLPVRVLDEAVDLFAQYGVRSWLVIAAGDHQDASAEHLELVEGRGGTRMDEAGLRVAFPDTPQPAPAPRSGGRVRLPRVSGYAFRSTCRDLLDPDHFAEIDTRFVELVLELRAEIAPITGADKGRTLRRKLQQRMLDAADTDELYLRVAAAQVAVVPYEFMITVSLPALLGAAEGLPRRGKATPERWWELLDTYRDPSIGAIAALYHSGIDPDVVRLVERSHVTPRNAAGEVVVTAGGEQYVLTGPAARFVEAQRVYRELANVGHSEYLFSTHRAGQVQLKHVNHQLLVPAADLDTQIATGPVRAKHPDVAKWLQRYGIRVEKLTHSPEAQAVGA